LIVRTDEAMKDIVVSFGTLHFTAGKLNKTTRSDLSETTAFDYIVQYSIILYNVVQYCTIEYKMCSIVQLCTQLYSAVPFFTQLYSVVNYCTIEYSIVQLNTILNIRVNYCTV